MDAGRNAHSFIGGRERRAGERTSSAESAAHTERTATRVPRQTRVCNSIHPSAYDIDDVAAVLRSGGLVLIPSDTTYILATMLLNNKQLSEGVAALFSLKKRKRHQAFPWIVKAPSDLEVFGCELSWDARQIARHIWPAPVTLVVRASSAVPKVLTRPDQTIALRMSSHPFVAGILQACDSSLIVSSANQHLRTIPENFSQINPTIMQSAGIVYEGIPDACQGISTIIDCTEGETRVVRHGCTPVARIEKAIGHRIASS